jgi:hypothetical protein
MTNLDRSCVSAFLAHCASIGATVTIIDRDEPETLDLLDMGDAIEEVMACDEALVRVRTVGVQTNGAPCAARFQFVFGNVDEEAIATIADYSATEFGTAIVESVEAALTTEGGAS